MQILQVEIKQRKKIMKNNDLSSYNVGMVSLGCHKNQVDAERMLAILNNKGFSLSSQINDCDVVIVNTCAFIEDAKQESIDEILNLCNLKNDKNYSRLKLIVVTGCLAERYQHTLKEQIPEIDVLVGIGGNKDIANLIIEGLDNNKKEFFPAKSDMMICGERILTTPSHYAYLKIADGCNNRCTYCAIPMIKGSYKSEPREQILEEAKQLAIAGVKELNIIAQDVTCYGQDLYNKFVLPELLKDLCKIDGIEWIRLLYCYPDKITDELIDVIANEEKIVKYIDIPFQHVNDEVLKRMARKGDKQLILDVISKLRAKIPNIVIRSTFIVGFPGETDEQFNELLDFIKTVKLQNVGCFKYSQEEDTKAAQFSDQISEEVKNIRYEALMRVQDEVIEEHRRSYSGKIYKILVEDFNEENNLYYGRSYMQAPGIDDYIEFDLSEDYNGKNPEIGEFVDVKL